MKDCQKIREECVAYLYGELQEKQVHQIESHLDHCPSCQKELNGLKAVFNGADAFSADIERNMAKVDWEALPEKITKNVFQRERIAEPSSRPGKFWSFLFKPQLRPVYAALLIGIILGAAATFMLVRSPQTVEIAGYDLMVPQKVLDNMDVAIARRETLDYLDKSRYLLLDFVQVSPDKAADFWQSDFANQSARSLLSKKRFIDPQLDQYQMAKAKAICDQIEFLFIELTQISSELSAAELERVQNFIQDKQLLLKIKLVKEELQKSEV